jgi:hypothetical protein
MEKNIHNIVAKFNSELNEYYTATDNAEVLDIETTIIGSGGHIKYTLFKTVIRRDEYDGRSVFKDTFKLDRESEVEELLDQIRHDRKRLRKSWKVWKSENPDLEMEREDDED